MKNPMQARRFFILHSSFFFFLLVQFQFCEESGDKPQPSAYEYAGGIDNRGNLLAGLRVDAIACHQSETDAEHEATRAQGSEIRGEFQVSCYPVA